MERKLFTASATASAMLPRPQRQLPRHTFHIYPFRELPRTSFLCFCFRDHSATTFSKVCGSFWLWLVSFPFILAFWAFISFHFGLFLKASGRGVLLFGHVFLPRCFREASARLPQNTEAKPVIKPTKRSDLATLHPKIKFQYSIWDMETKLHQDSQIHILSADPSLYPLPTSPSATFRNLPRRTSFREASAAFRGLNPVHFLLNKKLRKLLHKNGKKKRNSFALLATWATKLPGHEAWRAN